MKISLASLLVVVAMAVASASTAVAAGVHGPAGGAHGKSHGLAKGKGKPHKVTYVFKGTWNAADSTVSVKHGNAHVRKAHLVGKDVQFDVTAARLVVADTNADGSIGADDLKDGDSVVVKARLGRKDPGSEPFAARMVIDRTNAPPADGSDAG